MTTMNVALIDEAIELIEKANADLEPELLTRPDARRLLDSYVRARRLIDRLILTAQSPDRDRACIGRLHQNR
ncbi:MAG: hypothetical protein ABR575_05635 [Actinomycetota bacterium]